MQWYKVPLFFSKSHHILNVHYISNQLARFAVPFDLCNRSYGITTHSASTKVTLWQFWNFILDVFTRGPWATLLTWENNREEDLNFVNAFLLFRNYLPLEKGGTFHLNKLESSSPKDALCHVLLKLAQRFWRRF